MKPRPSPPWTTGAGHLAHGGSWLLLAVLAAKDQLGFSLPGLAWVHLVTLGWLTLISLTILQPVLAGLFGLRWSPVTRMALTPYVAGVLGMVFAFWTEDARALSIAATVVLAAIGLWMGCAVEAFGTFVARPDRSLRALRAFQLVLGALGLTTIAGFAMAWTLYHGGSAWWLTHGPALHAHLGGLGWLTLLVVGVANRTLGEIFGRRSEHIALHVTALSGLLFALLAVVVALVGGPAGLAWVGLALAALGVCAHAADIAILAWKAGVWEPSRAFIGAATIWLAVAVVLGAGVLAGQPWSPVYGFVALIGWVGQMVNGHLHRSAPSAPLGWAAFAAFQLAVLGVVAGGLAGLPAFSVVGAIAGGAGWTAMTANLALAARSRGGIQLPAFVAV